MYNFKANKKFPDEDQSSVGLEPYPQGLGTTELASRSGIFNQMSRSGAGISSYPGLTTPANVAPQQFGRNSAGLQAGSQTPTNNDSSHQLSQSRMSMYAMSGNRPMHSQMNNTEMQSPTQSISPEMYANRINQNGPRIPAFSNHPQMSFQLAAQNNPMLAASADGTMTGGGSMGITGSTYQEEYPPLKGTRPIGSQTVTSGVSAAVASNHGAQKTGYGVMNKAEENVKKSEFQLQNEEFPALPVASQGMNNHMNSVFPDQDGRGDESNHKFNPLGVQIGGQGVDKSKPKLSAVSNGQQKGIQILPDNTVKNIPKSMLRDQYGIVGLLAFIKAAETTPPLTHLALGTDLTTLGLNLNSPDNLYHRFQSPFSKQPCRLQDIDSYVPTEYLTNAQIRDKLAPIKLARYGDDLLFFVFYSYPGDIMQYAAASELYNRDWRYHKEDRVWITRAPGVEPIRKCPAFEQGTYLYFDCKNWKKIAKEFHLEYEKLEERPNLPNLTALHYNPSQHG